MKTQINIRKKTKERFEKFRAVESGIFGIVMTQDEALELLLDKAEKVNKK